MEKCYYVENQQYSKEDLIKSLGYAIHLNNEDSTIEQIIILVYTKNQFVLLNSIFSEKDLKKGIYKQNGVIFKFETIKTYKPSYSGKHDIVIVVGVAPSDIKNIENEFSVKYLIYVPWNINECISWLRAHNAEGITTNVVLKPESEINPILIKAIDWLNDTSYPNQGFSHPLDNNRLKSVANALNEMKISIEEESIIAYCHEIGILYNSAYKIIEYFQKAKNSSFRTDKNYSLDYFHKILTS